MEWLSDKYAFPTMAARLPRIKPNWWKPFHGIYPCIQRKAFSREMGVQGDGTAMLIMFARFAIIFLCMLFFSRFSLDDARPFSVAVQAEVVQDGSKRVPEPGPKPLGTASENVSVEKLIEVLKDNSRRWLSRKEYEAAVQALVRIGKPAVPALIEELKDDFGGCVEAAEALGKIGDSAAVPALIEALKDDSGGCRELAVDALGMIGDPAVPALIEALKDDSGRCRSRAVDALGMIGDPAAVPALIEALKDDSEAVRVYAVDALVSIGDPDYIPALIDVVLTDNVLWVRENAATRVFKRISDSPSSYAIFAKAAHSGNLFLWRFIYSIPSELKKWKEMRSIPTYWFLSPITWVLLLLIWATFAYGTLKWRLSEFGSLVLLVLILVLPIGWLFNCALWAGFIALSVSLILLNVHFSDGTVRRAVNNPGFQVELYYYERYFAVALVIAAIAGVVHVGTPGTSDIVGAVFSVLIALTVAAVFVPMQFEDLVIINLFYLIGSIAPITVWGILYLQKNYWTDYFFATALDSLFLCIGVLLVWLFFGIISTVSMVRFLPWLKSRRQAFHWLCMKDHHRFRLGLGLPWLVRWSGRLLAFEVPRRHENFDDYFVCRCCSAREDFVTARHVIGVIGAIPSPTATDEVSVSLFDPTTRQTISADIDRLDLYPPPPGQTLDYDYAVNAVLNALSEDHHRTRRLKQIPVRIHGQPPLPENTRRMLADRFGSVKNVA